jgi:hypothetical protein
MSWLTQCWCVYHIKRIIRCEFIMPEQTMNQSYVSSGMFTSAQWLDKAICLARHVNFVIAMHQVASEMYVYRWVAVQPRYYALSYS